MKKDILIILGLILVAAILNAIMDYFHFRVAKNGGFWSITDGQWDIWHISKKLMQGCYLIMGWSIYKLSDRYADIIDIRFRYKHLFWIWVIIFAGLTLTGHEFLYHGILK